MKKKACVLLSSITLIASLAGCTNTSGAAEENAKQFLTWIYTTDENERYTEFMNNVVAGDEDSMNECLDAFYENVEDIVEEDILDALTAKRIPMKYDELYLNDHVTVEDITLSKAEDKYDYTVNAHYGSGDLSFTGMIGLGDDQKINYFYDSSK